MRPIRPQEIRRIPFLLPNRCLRPSVRAGQIAPLCVLLLLMIPRIAAAIDLDVLVGFGQNTTSGARYRPDTWTPITVFLSGQGARGVGQLQLSVRSNGHETLYTRSVPLTDGALNQAENFAVQLSDPYYSSRFGGAGAPEIHISLQIDGRVVAGPKAVALPGPIGPETFNVLALTRDGTGLSFLTRKKLGLIHHQYNPNTIGGINFAPNGEGFRNDINPNATLQPLVTDTRALPARPQGYSAIDAIALGDLPLDSLSEDQTASLRRYVVDGGLLIVAGGGDLARLKSRLYQDLLPVTPNGVQIVPSLSELARRYHAPLSLTGGMAVTQVSLKAHAHTLLAEADGKPLVVSMPYGCGAVVFTAFDALDPSLRAWSGAPGLWRDLLRCGNDRISARELLNSSHMQGRGGSMLADALAGVRALQAPPFGLLALFCGAYLILLVPVNYFILKKLDRRELTWITAPALIAAFTAGSYLFARSIKGGDLTAHRAVVLETSANSLQIAGTAMVTFYSPQRTAYNIAFGTSDSPDNPYRLLCPEEIGSGVMQNIGSDLDIYNDASGTTLRNTLIRLWDKRSFATPVALADSGGIEAITRMQPDNVHAEITVTNHTGFTLTHCALVGAHSSLPIGSLAPGASLHRPMEWSTAGLASSIPVNYDDAPYESANAPLTDSPEQNRARIAHALSVRLSTNADNSNGFMPGAESGGAYGHTTNAFVGWFSDPVLDARVDGRKQPGEEVNLLLVHLPVPDNAPLEMRAADNPFAIPAVTDLEDVERKGPQGRNP